MVLLPSDLGFVVRFQNRCLLMKITTDNIVSNERNTQDDLKFVFPHMLES